MMTIGTALTTLIIYAIYINLNIVKHSLPMRGKFHSAIPLWTSSLYRTSKTLCLVPDCTATLSFTAHYQHISFQTYPPITSTKTLTAPWPRPGKLGSILRPWVSERAVIHGGNGAAVVVHRPSNLLALHNIFYFFIYTEINYLMIWHNRLYVTI